MRLFPQRHEAEATVDDDASTAWPDDSLNEIDDAAFARAIAAGRKKEHDGELIDA